MYSAPDLNARNERKAKRLATELLKTSELAAITDSLERLKELSDDDDAINPVQAGTINGLILSMEACLSAIRAHIKV